MWQQRLWSEFPQEGAVLKQSKANQNKKQAHLSLTTLQEQYDKPHLISPELSF